MTAKIICHNDYVFDFSNKQSIVVKNFENGKIVCVYDYIKPVFAYSLPPKERMHLMNILNEVIRMKQEWEW